MGSTKRGTKCVLLTNLQHVNATFHLPMSHATASFSLATLTTSVTFYIRIFVWAQTELSAKLCALLSWLPRYLHSTTLHKMSLLEGGTLKYSLAPILAMQGDTAVHSWWCRVKYFSAVLPQNWGSSAEQRMPAKCKNLLKAYIHLWDWKEKCQLLVDSGRHYSGMFTLEGEHISMSSLCEMILTLANLC